MFRPTGLMYGPGIIEFGKGCPVSRIARRRQQALGKVAAPLGLGRHVGDPSDSFATPGMFIVGEEKHAILRDRTTNRSSGLFAVVGGRGFVARRKEIPRVECTSSKESIQGSMECIASRPRDYIDLSGAITPEGRVVAVGRHAKLLDGVDGEPDSGRVEFGIDVIDAVEQKPLRVLAATVGSQREVPAKGTGRTLRCGRSARSEQGKLEEIASVERKAGHLTALDHRRQGCRLALHGLHSREDIELLQNRTDRQTQVQPALLVHLQFEPGRAPREALFGRLEKVKSGLQRRDCEPSGFGRCRGRPLFSGRFVGDAHGGLWNGSPRRIHDRSANRCQMRLRGNRRRKNDQRKQDNQCLHLNSSGSMFWSRAGVAVEN